MFNSSFSRFSILLLATFTLQLNSYADIKTEWISGSASAGENIELEDISPYEAAVCSEYKNPDQARRDSVVKAVAIKVAELRCTDELRGRIVSDPVLYEKKSSSYDCKNGVDSCTGRSSIWARVRCEFEDPTPERACEHDPSTGKDVICRRSVVNLSKYMKDEEIWAYESVDTKTPTLENVTKIINLVRQSVKSRAMLNLDFLNLMGASGAPSCAHRLSFSLIDQVYFPSTKVEHVVLSTIGDAYLTTQATAEAALVRTCCNPDPRCDRAEY